MRRIKTISKWALISVKIAYRVFAISAEVLCRHSFGQRYASELILGSVSCFLYVSVCEIYRGKTTTSLLTLYLVVYVFLVCYHLLSIWSGRRVAGYSVSNGEPWKFWHHLPISTQIVKIVFEPCLLILGACIISPYDAALSFWLIGSGISHLLKQAIFLLRLHRRVLDALDARIEGEHMSEAVRRYRTPGAAQAQAAPTVVVTTRAAPSRSETLEEIVNNLDPALRRLMSGSEESSGRPLGRLRSTTTRSIRFHSGPLGSLPRIRSRRKRT